MKRLLLVSAMGAAMPAMAEAAKPNIVLFNIDDLGWSDLAESNPKMVDKLYGELDGWLEQMDAPRDFEPNPEYVSYNGK